MKRLKYVIVFLTSMFAFNMSVNAASGNLSVSTGSVYTGDSFTVTANVYGAAAWNVHVSASGPVSGCVINQADATADAMDTNRSFSATCTATGAGTISIVLSGDATSASDGNAVGISGSAFVNVSDRPAPAPAPTPDPTPTPNPTPTPTPGNNTPATTDNRSTNNSLKELSIDGYDLVKVDNNNYTLEVSNDVSSIKVKAVAEDSKAKVEGVGSHSIKVGENTIEVIVTAENGAQNRITIKITRKDGYYLEDLDSLLKSNSDASIIIESDTVITSSMLEKIKASKKIVKFNYYDEEQNLIYSWIIDGSKLDKTTDLLTTISYTADNKKEILKQANYPESLFIVLNKNLPLGTKIKVYVGENFDDEDLVNIFSYNEELKQLSNNVVENGYIEFDVTGDSIYLLTLSNLKDDSLSPIVLILLGAAGLFVVELIILIIVKTIKKGKTNNNENYKEPAIEKEPEVLVEQPATIDEVPVIIEDTPSNTQENNESTLQREENTINTYNNNQNMF